MNFIDSHSHLVLEAFDADRDTVIQEAFSNGITHLIQSCDNLEEVKRNLALTQKYENIYSSVGIHPHEAKDWDENSKDIILKYSKEKKVLAIGEIGLDFYYNLSSKEEQIKAFREQIKIANESSLPIIIHTRDASKETIEILKEEKASTGGVFHCYTGDLETAKEALNLGFYISWSGIITFKTAGALRKVAKEIPIERTLIETDAPFLSPIPHRGKRNEPKFVKHVAEEIAKIYDIPLNVVGEITSENTKKVFNFN